MKPKRFCLAIALLFSLSAAAARAEILAEYWTDGCSECVYEYDDASDEFRYLEKACGDGCWTTSPWTACGGNCNFRPPNPNGLSTGPQPAVHASDYVIVHVLSGKGGGISPYSGGTGGNCRTFTPDGSSYIRIPDAVTSFD
ncbi:MAG: hypothetical protein JWQ98_3363 [Chlorobi bacterium]|nr:hypothetical protein [Chlorobiota bacterium]